jgi:ATP-binding cassette subfamily F protein uup
MTLLNAAQLSKSYGPQTLFENLTFTIDEGEKVGVIGPNGCGKSSLFRILVGEQEPDGGTVARRRDASLYYVPQEPAFDPALTPSEIVAQAVGPLQQALARFAAISDELTDADAAQTEALLGEQADLQHKIDRFGGWAWEHRAETILDRLGVSRADMRRPLGQLSGGMQRRVALARSLLARPDLLILDEPTNHLDAQTVEWLEEELLAYPGAVLLVTHDRYFLDRVVTRILEFDIDGLYSYDGAYEEFTERKLERIRLRQATEDRRTNLLVRELEWLRRQPKARGTKAQARVQRAENLIDGRIEVEGKSLQGTNDKLKFRAESRVGDLVLEARGLAKAYDGRTIFSGVDLTVFPKDRIGVLGPNGTGKTTLLKILLGQETHDAGEFQWARAAKPSFLSQTREGLNPEHSVLETLGEGETVQIGERRMHKKGYLKEFLFDYGQQTKKVRSLSGGERCRLLLAHMMLQEANVLLLDEPTNDLDIPTLQFLEDSLHDFAGAVLLVTHDRWLMNRLCTSILAFEDGTARRYDGDYDFYKRRRDEALAARKAAEQEQAAKAKAAQPAPAKAAPPAKRKLTWAEKQELAKMEETILAAEDEKSALEAKLSAPNLYRAQPQEAARLQQALSELTARVERLYTRWAELEAV